MRVNSKVFTERSDMMGDIKIPNCQPKELCTVCERIMNMVTALDYSVGDYNSVTELDKLLTVDYWKTYDGLTLEQLESGWRDWFVHKATEAEIISRARRWLVERNYLLLKPEIIERSQAASAKFSNAVKGK
jgi:hypothetical protein